MRGWGFTLIVIGVGSFVLPLFGLQFKVINIFGAYQGIAGIVSAVLVLLSSAEVSGVLVGLTLVGAALAVCGALYLGSPGPDQATTAAKSTRRNAALVSASRSDDAPVGGSRWTPPPPAAPRIILPWRPTPPVPVSSPAESQRALEQAQQTLRQAEQTIPDPVRRVYQLADQARLAAKGGRPRRRAALYQAIADLDPRTAAWHRKEAALAWLDAGEDARALAAARASVASPPERRSQQLEHFWHRALADVFLKAGEPALAIPHYEQAIQKTNIEGYREDCLKRLDEARQRASA